MSETPTDPRRTVRRAVKALVFVVSCLPLAWLVFAATTGKAGPNPIEYAIRTSGDWALRFLLIALTVTPVRILTGWVEVMRLRRMLGLFAFFYVCLHILAYVGLDQYFDWAAIFKDVVKRIYITIGMAAFLMLTALAATSTNAMVRRLGARRWRRLHRIVYLAAVLGIIHFIMMLKTGYQEPVLYAAILAVLLAVRAAKKWP